MLRAYLRLVEHSAEAVEQLEGRKDLALHQHACEDCRGGPDARDDGHVEEPYSHRQHVLHMLSLIHI